MPVLHIHARNETSTATNKIDINIPSAIHSKNLIYKSSNINFFEDINPASSDGGLATNSANHDALPNNIYGCVYAKVPWIGGNSINSNVGTGKIPIAVNHSTYSAGSAVLLQTASTYANYDMTFRCEDMHNKFTLELFTNDSFTPLLFADSGLAKTNIGNVRTVDLFFEYDLD